ncbi:hypothetical protein TTHERM_000191099 (macronuclear) [Tetrahymena thermophila SB210]|uniref:Uncharacterized protein n=1 Tax=Tetrahymena thermophila (strain SB210) TaxID=312017 RepID=W7X4I8_TETTS|nr:hypothetical protein TTHERM_000191099 [Tetrahymena thermophila SB210]EWS74250.1 hypothetical protein TTHERM_000191099 [Tetrahymena thermophila SB210]|eukprot:XP_012653223.1 hypothetical protein TTHERM_000191099 [Tetrahymena thermophila SB210]
MKQNRKTNCCFMYCLLIQNVFEFAYKIIKVILNQLIKLMFYYSLKIVFLGEFNDQKRIQINMILLQLIEFIIHLPYSKRKLNILESKACYQYLQVAPIKIKCQQIQIRENQIKDFYQKKQAQTKGHFTCLESKGNKNFLQNCFKKFSGQVNLIA